MAMGDAYDVGQRVGLAFGIFAIGALAGPPISGAIDVATGGYEAVGYYAGTFSTSMPAKVGTDCFLSQGAASWLPFS